jgi:hypothetical protein
MGMIVGPNARIKPYVPAIGRAACSNCGDHVPLFYLTGGVCADCRAVPGRSPGIPAVVEANGKTRLHRDVGNLEGKKIHAGATSAPQL